MNTKTIIKNFFLTLSGAVIVYGLYIIVTKKEPTASAIKAQSIDSNAGLAENGLPKTPDSLKIYLTPLLHENMGFKENLGLDPQASASLDIGSAATISCGYRFKDLKGHLAISGKFQVSGSLDWHTDPTALSSREKIQSKVLEACLGSPLMAKTISESEFNAVAQVTTTDRGIQQALSGSGVPIGKKWTFNIIQTNPTESMVWILTER